MMVKPQKNKQWEQDQHKTMKNLGNLVYIETCYTKQQNMCFLKHILNICI